MKVSSLSYAALAGLVSGFANINPDVLSQGLDKRQQLPDPTKRFSAKEQYVSTSGDHAWMAPDTAAGDQRGPCPGLNSMANHNYIPRNGVASHTQFIQGTFDVFGMSLDLSGFLTVLGATVDGDGLQWSIGGPSKALPGLPPLVGQPQGISGSHNKYECDASPGRGDLYQYGDDFTIQMNQYQQLYDMAIANGDDIDMDLLNEFRSKRFDQSINENPYFFNGPFTGVFVQPAAYYFIYRFMGNKSAEYPTGKLNTEIMNSFMGISKNADGSLTKNPGMERIPENFYKRAVGDEYSIPFFNADLLISGAKYPKFFSVGGNMGKTNSFIGLDIANITGGVYNAASLSEGNNLSCYISEFLTQATPDVVKCSNVLSDVNKAMSQLTDQMKASFGNLDCPKLTNPQTDQFKQFPGYADLNCRNGGY